MLPPEVDALLKSMQISDGDEYDSAASRTERMKEVLLVAKELSSATATDDIVQLAQGLATGLRNGASGLLDYFLGLLSDPTRPPDAHSELPVHIIRLAGNACADTDENRAVVVNGKHMPSILTLLEHDGGLARFVVLCIYNICLDYEPAQVAASEAGLSEKYASFLAQTPGSESWAFVGVMGKTLSLLIAHHREKNSASVAVPAALLKFSSISGSLPSEERLEPDAFCSLASAAVAYLSQELILLEAAREDGISASIFSVLELACETYSCDGGDGDGNATGDDDDDDVAVELKALRKALVGVIADLTATLEWEARHPSSSDESSDELVHKIRGSWLLKHHSPLQEAACLTLGNLACSDASSRLLVQNLRVHEQLIDLLAHHYPYQPGPDDTVPSALLHAAIGLLKNLAIPIPNKSLLGTSLLSVVGPAPSSLGGERKLDGPAALSSSGLLTRLLASADTQPQTQLAIVTLARLLLVGTPLNGALLCAPIPLESGQIGPRTTLHTLIELFAKADAKPTKTEAARTALALCRLLHSPTASTEAGVTDVDTILPAASWVLEPASASSSDAANRRARFYAAHEGMVSLLSFLVVQKRFPALRSEAWFVFALMSRSSDGASLVMRALTAPSGGGNEEAVEALVRAVVIDHAQMPEQAGSSAEEQQGSAGVDDLEALAEPRQAIDPKQAASMAKVDRENGLVLITELLQNHDGLSGEHKARFKQLLRSGGEIVLVARTKDGEGGGSSS